MPTNPLVVAHKDALKVGAWIAWATGRYFGSVQHKRGEVLSIYRKARRDMSGALKAQRYTLRAEAQEILADTRVRLDAVTTTAILDAAAQGQTSALVQLAAYADDGVQYTPQMLPGIVAELQKAPMAEFDRQALQILGLIAGGGDVQSAIVGDANRVGIFSPAPVVNVGTDALTKSVSASFANTVGREPAQEFGWHKQVMAAIDDRTTECCLTACGQAVKVNAKFHLTAEPRFADEMDWVPFHWYCRSSVALYLPQYDDGLTAQLLDNVAAERAKRAVIEAEKEVKREAREAKKK